MRRTLCILLLPAVLLIAGCATPNQPGAPPNLPKNAAPATMQATQVTPAAAMATIKAPLKPDKNGKVIKTDDEWRNLLTPEQFDITRRAGTERPFTGTYWNNHADGIYRCVDCGQELFSSSTKFESGTGWPSFWQPLASDRVSLVPDFSDDMTRTEVRCSRCDAHLGHVFDDGPAPTNQRYCMNSAALVFVPKAK